MTTKDGTPAFDVVLTLVEGDVSDTTDIEGGFRLHKEGTAILTEQTNLRKRIDNGAVGKTVGLGIRDARFG